MRLILLGTADLIWEYLLPSFFPGKENYQGLSRRRIWVLIRTVDSIAVCWFLIRELPNDNDFLWPGGEMSPKKEHSCHREDLRLRPGVYICWLFWYNFLAPGEHISSRSYGWGWLISAVFAHPVSFPLSLQLITPRFLRRLQSGRGGCLIWRGWDWSYSGDGIPVAPQPWFSERFWNWSQNMGTQSQEFMRGRKRGRKGDFNLYLNLLIKRHLKPIHKTFLSCEPINTFIFFLISRTHLYRITETWYLFPLPHLRSPWKPLLYSASLS